MAKRSYYLSYSSNVHAAESADDLMKIVSNDIAPICKEAFGSPGQNNKHPINLRWSKKQIDSLLDQQLNDTEEDPDVFFTSSLSSLGEDLQSKLQNEALELVSVNAFPILDFHAERVKETVYLPDWTETERVITSVKAAKLLADLLPANRNEGAVSVPTGVFKGKGNTREILETCAQNLAEAAAYLFRLAQNTGKTISLGLEPEPFTTAENFPELVDYFENYIFPAALTRFDKKLGISKQEAEIEIRKLITVNLDLCHQAVEFEDPLEVLKSIAQAGIKISGLHLSAALVLENPCSNKEGLEELMKFDEPRWLHQVIAKNIKTGVLHYFQDLPEFAGMLKNSSGEAKEIGEARCHFHVPLHAEITGALGSTRESVGPAARYALQNRLTDNFIVETYTWERLLEWSEPAGQSKTMDGSVAQTLASGKGNVIHRGLAQELMWASKELNLDTTS